MPNDNTTRVTDVSLPRVLSTPKLVLHSLAGNEDDETTEDDPTFGSRGRRIERVTIPRPAGRPVTGAGEERMVVVRLGGPRTR